MESDSDSEDQRLLEEWMRSKKTRPLTSTNLSSASISFDSTQKNSRFEHAEKSRETNERNPERTLPSKRSRGGPKQAEIRIIVSTSLFRDKSVKDVLKVIREQYDSQIVVSEDAPDNTITWGIIKQDDSQQSKDPVGEDAGVSLLIFSAEQFLNHILYRTLDALAKKVTINRERRIFFCVSGIEKECAKRARLASRSDETRIVISKRAVQDCFTHLYMDYNIQVRSVETIDDVADYISILTNAIAKEPYHEDTEMFEASLKYRQKQNGVKQRNTIVVNSQATNMSQDRIDSGSNMGMGSEGEGGVNESEDRLAPHIRSEGREDLGYVYTSVLGFIPGMSLVKANSVRKEYPTLNALLTAYDRCQTPSEKECMLANLTYGSNHRRLGPKLSKAIAKVLLAEDPQASL